MARLNRARMEASIRAQTMTKPQKPKTKPKTTARKNASGAKQTGKVETKKERELSPRVLRFIEEYPIDLNGKQAAIRSGFSAKTAQEQASRLLSNVKVQEAIQQRLDERSERTQIDADWVLKRWAAIAQADPNTLVQYRRGCCRHCWGIDHLYQWTAAELEEANQKAEEQQKPAPEAAGGTGFDRNRAPHPECPECGGEGRGRMFVADTRTLPEAAKTLYAGVKVGKDGLEVKMRDQDAALTNIARHLGMFPSKVELTGKNGGPIVTRRAKDLTDDELAEIIAGSTEGGSGA